MPDDKQYNTLALVSGTDKQKEKQKSNIRQYCSTAGLATPTEDEFISDWQTLKNKLQKEAYGAIVVDNLRTLSTNVKEVAYKLYELIYEDKEYVYSVNEVQDKKVLEKRRQKHTHISKERILMQIEIDLRDVL
jgi:hypothetical protein